MSALRFLKREEATSGVSSLNVTDVFSSDYEVYKIIWDNWSLTGAAGWVDLRFINEQGSVLLDANYCGAHLDINSSSGSGTHQSANQTYFDRGLVYNNSTTGAAQEAWIYNPYADDRYTTVIASTRNDAGSGDSGDYKLLSFKNVARVTGIQAVQRSGYNFTGSVKVYGIRAG